MNNRWQLWPKYTFRSTKTIGSSENYRSKGENIQKEWKNIKRKRSHQEKPRRNQLLKEYLDSEELAKETKKE